MRLPARLRQAAARLKLLQLLVVKRCLHSRRARQARKGQHRLQQLERRIKTARNSQQHCHHHTRWPGTSPPPLTGGALAAAEQPADG